MYMSVWPACVYYVTCVLSAHGSAKRGSDPRTGVPDGCDPTTRLLGTKPRCLKEQQVLLTAEPALSSLCGFEEFVY